MARGVNQLHRLGDGLRGLLARVDGQLGCACLTCRSGTRSASLLCRRCLDELPWLGPHCRHCAMPLPGGGVCGRCLNHPPPFDAAHAALRYETPVDFLIGRLKFGKDLAAARALARLLVESIQTRDQPPPDALIPVPLHAGRLRQRGFNQSQVLASLLGRQLGIPVVAQGIRRVRATPPQMALPRRKRRSNIRGAFRIDVPLIDTRVGIVDDVMTTGATLAELAKAARRAGAASVEVWAAARTI